MADLSVPNFLQMRTAYEDIYDQYVDDASFLWLLRSVAVKQAHYDASDILELEQRIESQLDGLMGNVDLGWQACEDVLALHEPGEVFTAMVVAMRSHETSKIQMAVEVGIEDSHTLPGLISAMGWLPDNIVDPWIERFLQSKNMAHKYLGLAACSVRRLNPGQMLTRILQREDCFADQRVYGRALRLVGELRRHDCMPALVRAMQSEHEEICFWANWSAALLGHRTGIADALKPIVFKSGRFQDRAINLVFRLLPVEQARDWLSILAQDEDQQRAVIKATGVLGDPHAINWLISKMYDPRLAKLAGESFSIITGVDFDKQEISIDEPAIHQKALATEIEEIEEDENLPYPDVEKVADLWLTIGQNFIVGRRYFVGHPMGTQRLKEKLVHGNQRLRYAAAMELALNEDDVPLPNTRGRILAF